MSDNRIVLSFPLSGMLLILFLTLKLVGVIDWSWWWVLSPLWVPFVLVLLLIALTAAVYGVASWVQKRRWRRGKVGRSAIL